MLSFSERHAKSVLRSLESSGQPPKWGASLINVGTDLFLADIEEEFLKDQLLPLDGLDGGGACKWIEADYGNGKTQFLRCVQELAWKEQFVTAFVELSKEECPLDRIDLIYGSIAKAMQPPPIELGDVDRVKGLDNTILQLVNRAFPNAIAGGTPESELLIQWVDQLASVPVESSAITTAAASLVRSVMHGDTVRERIARAFLRGDSLPAAELREIGVHEKLDKASGFRLLRSVCQFLQRTNLANGVVLLFDEARSSLSLMASKAQKTACENLLSIINKCNSGDLPGTLFLYAVMPEFFTNFATTYPALQQRCSPRTRIPLNVLSGINEQDLLVEIGGKISHLFSQSYKQDFSDKVLTKNLSQLASACIRASMGTGTRRLMVQATVAMLNDAKHVGKMTIISAEQAEAFIVGANTVRTANQMDEVENEGE